jgi:hypothetical protein
MPSLSDHLAAIANAKNELRAAINGAASSWEQPALAPEADEVNTSATGQPWTPKQATIHALSALGFFTGFAAAGLGIEFGTSRPAADTTDEALASLDAAFAAFDEIITAANDDSLTLPAPVGDGQVSYAATRGYQIEKDVAGALNMVELHTADHATQIARGTTAVI